MLDYIIAIVAIVISILAVIEVGYLRWQVKERWRYDDKQLMRILAAQYYAQGNKIAGRRMVDKLKEYEAKYPNYADENNITELRENEKS